MHEDRQTGAGYMIAENRVLPGVPGRQRPPAGVGDEHLDRLGARLRRVPQPAGREPSRDPDVGADRPAGLVRWHEPRTALK